MEKKYQKNIYHDKVRKGKLVAFCHYRPHCGALTVENLKKHECLRKQCPHLEKFEHDFWVEREKIKQLKKQKKALVAQLAEAHG